MLYSIPYLALITTLAVLAFLYSNSKIAIYKALYTTLGVGLFIFFFGFRGYIMSDWIIYHDLFYECTFQDIISFKLSADGYVEPGFTLFMLICKGIFRDYHFFVFISTLLNTILLLRFFNKHSDNILLGLMLFVVFDGLTIIVNLMRNAIAILIILNAIEYLQTRKPLQYFGLCLIAVSFHISTSLFIPLYFFFHIRFPRWCFISVIVLLNIIYLLHIPIFAHLLSMTGLDTDKTDKVIAYTQKLVTTSKISIGYLERLFTSFLIICYYNKLYEIRKGNGVFLNAFLAYLMFLFVFSDFPIIGHRMANLFAFGYWILWGDLIKCFAIENNRRLFSAFVYFYCAFRIIGSTQLPDFEYENVLLGARSYEERLYLHNKTFEETF